jgi:predicted ester cyclase
MAGETVVESANMGALRRLVEQGFGQGDLDVVREIVAPDCVEHQFGMVPPNGDGTRNAVRFLKRLAPDFDLVVEDMVEQGDKVWARLTGTGTHTGPGLGEPTGRRWEITVIDIARFENGRIVEHWGVPDRFAQLAQLGLLPSAG